MLLLAKKSEHVAAIMCTGLHIDIVLSVLPSLKVFIYNAGSEISELQFNVGMKSVCFIPSTLQK